jgi:hypothetical protein
MVEKQRLMEVTGSKPSKRKISGLGGIIEPAVII